MTLITQAEYARQNNISRSAVTQIKNKLVLKPDPKTGKMLVDKELTDAVLGKNLDATRQGIQGNEQVTAASITIKARAQFEHYKAQNEKLKYETELGKLIPRDEALSQINEIASLVKSSVDNLKFHFKNNYDAKIAKKVSDDLDNMIKKLAGLNDD